MSRSYRRPFRTPAAGVSTQHEDRTRASRALRRLINLTLRLSDPDDVVLPIRREAAYNNRAEWSGDGRQRLWCFPAPNDQLLIARGRPDTFERRERAFRRLMRK